MHIFGQCFWSGLTLGVVGFSGRPWWHRDCVACRWRGAAGMWAGNETSASLLACSPEMQAQHQHKNSTFSVDSFRSNENSVGHERFTVKIPKRRKKMSTITTLEWGCVISSLVWLGCKVDNPTFYWLSDKSAVRLRVHVSPSTVRWQTGCWGGVCGGRRWSAACWFSGRRRISVMRRLMLKTLVTDLTAGLLGVGKKTLLYHQLLNQYILLTM